MRFELCFISENLSAHRTPRAETEGGNSVIVQWASTMKMDQNQDSGDDSFTEFDEADYVTLASPSPPPSSPLPSSRSPPPPILSPQCSPAPPILSPPFSRPPPTLSIPSPPLPTLSTPVSRPPPVLSPQFSLPPPNLSPQISRPLPILSPRFFPPPPNLSPPTPSPPQTRPPPTPPTLYPESNSTIRTFMNRSTVNFRKILPKSEIVIPKSNEEKTELIKKIVHSEMKRQFASVGSTPAADSKNKSLLIPKRQKLFLPLASCTTGQNDLGVLNLTAYPSTVATVSPKKSPRSILIDPNSPRTKASPSSKLSVLKARRNFQESLSQIEGKTKERKKDTTRKKMTKEEADSKNQEHREMVRGLFGKLDFLVCGGLG